MVYRIRGFLRFAISLFLYLILFDMCIHIHASRVTFQYMVDIASFFFQIFHDCIKPSLEVSERWKCCTLQYPHVANAFQFMVMYPRHITNTQPIKLQIPPSFKLRETRSTSAKNFYAYWFMRCTTRYAPIWMLGISCGCH